MESVRPINTLEELHGTKAADATISQTFLAHEFNDKCGRHAGGESLQVGLRDRMANRGETMMYLDNGSIVLLDLAPTCFNLPLSLLVRINGGEREYERYV